MAVGGFAQGGASAMGRSRAFNSLPWDGYREQEAWLEEWINALGLEFDILNNGFCTASARVNLLDPTYASNLPDHEFFATTTVAPTRARVQHTMLDIMLAASGIPWPVHGDLTVAQRQALVQAAMEAFKRKGNRLYLLSIAASMTDGVAYGWTTPPFSASIILPDGAPSPGYGDWVPAALGTVASVRPWILNEERRITRRVWPAWSQQGIGYSQFRAGYSGAGEPVFAAGATLNHLANEHFNAWSAGLPTSWSRVGTGTITQGSTGAFFTYVNFEFYDSSGNPPDVARLDLSSATNGTIAGLRQTATVNNQVPHRVELDYNYTNTQDVSVLGVKIADLSTGTFWDDANQAWTSTDLYNYVEPTTTRTRVAFDLDLNEIPASSNAYGTTSLRVEIAATCDGTATTKTTYDLYRVAVYERYSLDNEIEALGERLLWAPLKDAVYYMSNARSSSAHLVAPANASRSLVRRFSDTPTVAMEYHPALSQHGMRCSTAWSNLILGSNDFVTDWTTANATVTPSGTTGPEYSSAGVTSATASIIGTGASPNIFQSNLVVDPSNKTYSAGCWVKYISGNDTTVQLKLESITSHAQTFSITDEWQWLPMSPQIFDGSETDPLTFVVALGSTDQVIGVYGSYCYDVTSKPDVLYPPVCKSNVSATGTLTPTKNTFAVTDPYTKRQTCSAVRGACTFTFVPTCGRNPGVSGHSQPNGVLFDIAEGAAQNRVVLRVASNVLELRRWDDGGQNHAATLTLAYTADASTDLQWRRDEAITIYCAWNGVFTMLSAGESSAIQAVNGGWSANDDSLTAIGVGNDYNNANPIDGIVTGLEILLNGRPTG